MQQIKQITGIITNVRDLSPTAREYTIKPNEPLAFKAGAFINLFIEHKGKTIRRAFSISSNDENPNAFTLSIRLSPDGELTPILWNKDFTDVTIKLMGPLGLNTADKMRSKKVFLFGFGVGAGVVKSLAEHMTNRNDLISLKIVTGNRNASEIIHKDFFDNLVSSNEKNSVQYVVSDKNQTLYPTGYIQEHIDSYDFNNADVYMCGQSVACTALETAIKATNPQNCNYFVEDFQ